MIIPTLIELEQQYEKMKNEKFFDVDIEWHKLLHYINIVRNDIVNKNSIKFNLKKVDSKNTRKKKKIKAKSTQSGSTQSRSTQSGSTQSGSTQSGSTQSTQSTQRNSAKSTRRNSAKSRRRKSAKSRRRKSAKSTQSGILKIGRVPTKIPKIPLTNATAVMNGGNTDLFFLGITIIGAAIYMCFGNDSEKNSAKYTMNQKNMYMYKENYGDGTPVLYGVTELDIISYAIKKKKKNPDDPTKYKYKIRYSHYDKKNKETIREEETIDEEKIYQYQNLPNFDSCNFTGSRSVASLIGDWKSEYAANNDTQQYKRREAYKKWYKDYREEEAADQKKRKEWNNRVTEKKSHGKKSHEG